MEIELKMTQSIAQHSNYRAPNERALSRINHIKLWICSTFTTLLTAYRLRSMNSSWIELLNIQYGVRAFTAKSIFSHSTEFSTPYACLCLHISQIECGEWSTHFHADDVEKELIFNLHYLIQLRTHCDQISRWKCSITKTYSTKPAYL